VTEAVAEARPANTWAKWSVLVTALVGVGTLLVGIGSIMVADRDYTFNVEERELSAPDIRETYIGPGSLPEGESPRYLLRNVGGQGTEVLGAYYRGQFMPVISPAGAKLEIAAGGGDVLQLMPCYLARSLGPDDVAAVTDELDLAVGTRDKRKSLYLEQELVDLINAEHASLLSNRKCSNGQDFDNLQIQYLQAQLSLLAGGAPEQVPLQWE
jgi:hypothetical protein